MKKMLSLLFICCVMGITTHYGQAVPQQPDQPLAPVKTLAEGPMSGVEKPFFAVARDAETYRQLIALGVNLPAQNEDYFARHALIAAFLGQRPTGGYSVEIVRRKSRFALRERRPARGAMTTQVITTPFQVVEITLPFEDALDVDFDAVWEKQLRAYTVTQGDFTASGGFAGEMAKFRVAGRIKTMAYGNLRTFVFALTSVGGKETLRLNSAATGILVKGNEFALPYLHAGTFVKTPGNLLLAEANFGLSQRKLSFTFKHLPNNIADGYEGKGELMAVGRGRRQ